MGVCLKDFKKCAKFSIPTFQCKCMAGRMETLHLTLCINAACESEKAECLDILKTGCSCSCFVATPSKIGPPAQEALGQGASKFLFPLICISMSFK